MFPSAERRTRIEMQEHRVGVVSCVMALDMSIVADVNAHSARAKVTSYIGNSPGMKIRPRGDRPEHRLYELHSTPSCARRSTPTS